MKKTLKTATAALAISAFMCIPAFAAQTKEEFRAEAETYYSQMKELNAQIDPLRESSKQISDRFREIGKSYKESGVLPVSDEVWDQVKELRQSLKQYQSSKEDTTVKAMRQSVKEAVANEDYDGALATIKDVIASKEARLENAKAANDIWTQIDALLGE